MEKRVVRAGVSRGDSRPAANKQFEVTSDRVFLYVNGILQTHYPNWPDLIDQLIHWGWTERGHDDAPT